MSARPLVSLVVARARNGVIGRDGGLPWRIKGDLQVFKALTLGKPGVYGVECMPHASMGMIGLVQAGKGPSPNLAAARAVKLPPLAAKRMAPLLAQAR